MTYAYHRTERTSPLGAPVVADLALLDLAPAQVALIDEDGTIIETNRSWDAVAEEGCLGRPPHGGRLNYLAECEAAARRGCSEAMAIADGLRRVLAGEAPSFVAIYPCPAYGQPRWYQVMAAPVPGSGAVVVMHFDVTDTQRDPLTKLANHALFWSNLEFAVSQAERGRTIGGLLLVDLDGFKPINDSLGHDAGDRLLAEVGARLRGAARASDLVGRIGGDEFGVILTNLDGLPSAQGAANRYLAELCRTFVVAGQEIRIGGSAGLAVWPDHGSTSDELFESADKALYAAKRSGGDCCRLAS